MTGWNLPPGVSAGDVDRAANGSCPRCQAILDDGRCEKCGDADDDDEVECSVCKEVVDVTDTRICEHAGCERPVCSACERDGALQLEKGIPTCGNCSQR